jgi:phosphoglycerate dehydrogenase-like enzyme
MNRRPRTLLTVTNPDLKKMLFDQAAIDLLTSFSDVYWLEEGRKYHSEEIGSIISTFDAAITSWGSPKFTESVVKQGQYLSFIGHAAGSVVSVTEEAVYDAGISVVSANKLLARSTAESAVAMMLAGNWHLRTYGDSLRGGQWTVNSRETVPGLYGQTIGLIGYGDISQEVIRLLRPFGARVLLYSRYCSQEEAEEADVRLCSLDELLRSSDIVSLHSTWTQASENMIGEQELATMKDGALFVNTSRGPLVQEGSLLMELQSGRLRAMLDVYVQEPLPKDHPFLTLSNAWCFPHIGGFNRKLKSGMGRYIIDNLYLHLSGSTPEGLITKERFKRMTQQ